MYIYNKAKFNWPVVCNIHCRITLLSFLYVQCLQCSDEEECRQPEAPIRSTARKEAGKRVPVSLPETPSSHHTSYRSMRTSVSKRDSRGESPLVSSPLTASEQGGMNVSPLLTSAAAGALAKRKVARAEDLSRLTIKPSELDIMVSPPTPGQSTCNYEHACNIALCCVCVYMYMLRIC